MGILPTACNGVYPTAAGDAGYPTRPRAAVLCVGPRTSGADISAGICGYDLPRWPSIDDRNLLDLLPLDVSNAVFDGRWAGNFSLIS